MRSHRKWLFVILLPVALLWQSCCSPPQLSSVPVTLVPQHRDWWCWAASTEMISTYYGHRIDQCQSANYVHGTPPDCCTGCSGDCPGWDWPWGATIDEIKDNWKHWNFEFQYKADSLNWNQLKSTIATTSCCDHSPIMVVWIWYDKYGNPVGGHVVVAYGYVQIGNQRYVSYNNPWPPDCEKNGTLCTSVSGGEDAVTTYEAFANPPGGLWKHSFYAFSYVTP